MSEFDPRSDFAPDPSPDPIAAPMAVFTPVSDHEVRTLLAAYELGGLQRIEGIAAGIENSNFFVDTERGSYILTIFERLSEEHLPAYLGLMRHLAARGIPCPDPMADRAGRLAGTLHGKPCALVSRLKGRAIEVPDPRHCAEVGTLLARMHAAAADFAAMPDNPRGRAWWAPTASRIRRFLHPAQQRLLDDELAEQQAFAASPEFAALPCGPVHADLFRDNVLFSESSSGNGLAQLSGVIDFYFAGHDSWIYDLAVTVNDWCIDESSGAFEAPRLRALLESYCRRRAPSVAERHAWPMLLRAAALRFWLSRLHDLHCPRPAQMIQPKDPAHFERILRARRDAVPGLDGQ